jgi:hypothetical protein
MRKLLFAAVAASALLCSAAVAQQAPQNTMGQGWWGPMMGHNWTDHMMGDGRWSPMTSQGWMGPMMMDPSQHVEGRLAFLKTELKITGAQTQQWNAYADALRANAKRMGEFMNEMMSTGEMGPGMMMGQGQAMMGNENMTAQGQRPNAMSLPDRYDRAEQHMAAHMDMLETMKGPAIQLYGVLSEDQKHTADQLLGPMGMM